jgi:hypothetical protein
MPQGGFFTIGHSLLEDMNALVNDNVHDFPMVQGLSFRDNHEDVTTGVVRAPKGITC